MQDNLIIGVTYRIRIKEDVVDGFQGPPNLLFKAGEEFLTKYNGIMNDWGPYHKTLSFKTLRCGIREEEFEVIAAVCDKCCKEVAAYDAEEEGDDRWVGEQGIILCVNCSAETSEPDIGAF